MWSFFLFHCVTIVYEKGAYVCDYIAGVSDQTSDKLKC